MKKIFAVLGLGLLVAFLMVPQPAAAVDYYAVALVVDVSGSISDSNYTLQKTGYANAINALIPTDGTMAFSVIEFGQNNAVKIPWTLMDSAAAKTSFTNTLLNLDRSGITTTSTAIGNAITAANGYFGSLSSSINWTNYIIDVSTDGANNFGTLPATAAQNAVNSGLADVVNALGIGTLPTFAAGTNFDGSPAFNVECDTFAQFQAAINDKFGREIPVSTPEPATLLLLGCALAGLYGIRRKVS